MTARICPKCNNKLTSSDNYFCSNCGTKLPEEFVLKKKTLHAKKPTKSLLETAAKTNASATDGEIGGNSGNSIEESVAEKVETPSLKDFFQANRTVLSSLVLVFLLVLTGFVYKDYDFKLLEFFMDKTDATLNIKTPKQEDSQTQPTEASAVEDLVLESVFEAESSILPNFDYASFVPAEADLYMEFSDSSWIFFFDWFFDDSLRTEVESQLTKGLVVFSIPVGEARYWGVLANIEDSADLESAFSNLKIDRWNYTVLEDKVLIYDNENVLEKVEQTRTGLVKNYTLTPQYAKNKDKITVNSKAVIMFSGHEGKKALESIKEYGSLESISALIDEILDFGKNEVVIL